MSDLQQYAEENKRSIWWRPNHLLDFDDPLDYIPGQDIPWYPMEPDQKLKSPRERGEKEVKTE